MKSISTRVGLGFSVFALALGVSASALAAPEGQDAPHGQCSGEHGGKHAQGDRAARAAERFKKADKNADGFLTQAEVGDKRWGHLVVADSNRDGKVSAAELAEAHAEGKLGHGKRDKHPA